jgi:hypothetical protein
MNKNNVRTKFSVALGTAFIVQFFLSLISDVALFDPLVDRGDIVKTMTTISQHYTQAQLSVFLSFISIFVVIWLGVLLFSLLRKVNHVWATMGLAMYIVEGFLVIISKCFQLALIKLSISNSINADSALLGKILLDTKDFAYSMAIIPFPIGAFLFYFLLYKSKSLPSWIPIWGFLSVLLVFMVPLMYYGVPIPFFVVFPYLPFELFIGIYILIKGLPKRLLYPIGGHPVRRKPKPAVQPQNQNSKIVNRNSQITNHNRKSQIVNRKL